MDNYEWLKIIPPGWYKIGRAMIDECMAIDPTYTIDDLKEKWGTLRVYSSYDDKYMDEIFQIENFYCAVISDFCAQCGNEADKELNWATPLCKNCYKEINKWQD